MSMINDLLSRLNINTPEVSRELEQYISENHELINIIATEYKRTLLGDRGLYNNDSYRLKFIQEMLIRNGIPENEIDEIMAGEDDDENEEEETEDVPVKSDSKSFCILTGVLLKELYDEIVSACPEFIKSIGNSFGSILVVICLTLFQKFDSVLDIEEEIAEQFIKYVRSNVANDGITMVHRNYIVQTYMFYVAICLTYGYINMADAIRMLTVLDKTTGDNEALSNRFVSELVTRSIASEVFRKKLMESGDIGRMYQMVVICSAIDMVESPIAPDTDYKILSTLSLTRNDVVKIATPTRRYLYVIEHRMQKQGSVYRIHRVNAADVFNISSITDQFVEKIVYTLNDVRIWLDKNDMSAEAIRRDRMKDKSLIVQLKTEMYKERNNLFMRNIMLVIIAIVVTTMIIFLSRSEVQQKIKQKVGTAGDAVKSGIEYVV